MKKKLLAFIITLVLPTSALASQSFDPRSMAMGGIGVSTATYLNAPLHNPALAAKYNDDDQLGFFFPAIGMSIYDKGDIINGLNDISDSFNRLDNIINGGDPVAINAAAQNVLSDLRALQGDTASVHLGGAAAVAVPNALLSVNVSLQGYVDATVYSDITNADLTLTNLVNPNYKFTSKGAASGVGVVELGVTLAKSLELERGFIYYGVTPKIQQVHTINYAVGINSFDSSNFDSDDYMNSKTVLNIDAGIVYALNGFNVGLVGKNLVPQEFGTATILGVHSVYSLNPVFTASASYATGFFTIGVDVDLNETERFENLYGLTSGQIHSDYDNTQMAGIGAEINVLDWVQVRAGYQMDIANNVGDQFTFGAGFSPLGMFRFDLAGTYGGGNQFGGALQTSMMF